MRMPGKFHQTDQRQEWHKKRTEYILAKKKVREESQVLGGDDLVWQSAAAAAVLYHLGLLQKNKQQ